MIFLVADSNQDLIALYSTLQREGLKFIEYCESFFDSKYNNEKAFYRFRDIFNKTKDIREKSALFLYLNRHCYNGLCRYNAKGKFNAPFGRYKKPYFPQQEMEFFHKKSRNAVFVYSDFLTTMKKAQKGDVVYCDPPYVPLSATANFTSYATGGFSMEQQKQLAQMAEKLAQKGITVVISNHDTEFIHSAYSYAKIFSFEVQRFISCNGTARAKAPEVLAVFA